MWSSKMDIDLEVERIDECVQNGNYHAAYNIALSGMNACRKEKNQGGIDRFIDIIRGVVDSLAAEFGSQTGSFS